MSSICTILVTFNRVERLRETLPRLLADPAISKVLVVDNASTDGTSAFLAALVEPKLALLSLPENSGGAGGFAAGMQHARERFHFDWLLLQDDDAWPEPGTLTAFDDRGLNLPSDIGAVAAAVFRPDGSLCDMNRVGYMPLLSIKNLRRFFRKERRVPDAAYAKDAPLLEIDLGTFVGMMVHRRVLERADVPDASLFIYGDDWDYSLRMRKAGFRLLLDPGFRYVHDITSQPTGNARYASLWQLYFSCRNGIILQHRYLGLLAHPVSWLRARQWRRDAIQYADPEAALRMVNLAVQDGRRGDTSRTRADIQALLDPP